MGAPLVDGFIEQDARGIISGWSADQDQRTLYAVVEQ